MEEERKIEIAIRTVDEDGNEERMYKSYNESSTDNGMDAYFLYEQLIHFMRMVGFHEDTITQIKWVDKEDK